MRGIVVAGLLALARPAVADDAARAPGFVVLPGFDRTSRVGLEGDGVLQRVGGGNYMRIALHVQYVDSDLGLGAYVGWNHFVAYPGPDSPENGYDLGALYVVPGSALDAPDLRLVLHGGISGGAPLVYATSSGAGGPLGEGGASLLARGDDVYGRFDLAFAFSGLTLSAAQLDAGIGYDAGDIAIGAEAMWASYEQALRASSLLPALDGAVSVRYIGAEIQPYVAVTSTFDGKVVGGVVGIEDRR